MNGAASPAAILPLAVVGLVFILPIAEGAAPGPFLVRSLHLDDGTVQCVAFSPDGRIMAGCGDRLVQFFDPKTGERLQRLAGHADKVRSLAFSPDGKLLLTYAFARKTPDHQPFLQKARRLLCLKSTREVHDFKYPVALFEHYQYASPEWKPNVLAASVHHLHGTQMEDSSVVREAREAL